MAEKYTESWLLCKPLLQWDNTYLSLTDPGPDLDPDSDSDFTHIHKQS